MRQETEAEVKHIMCDTAAFSNVPDDLQDDNAAVWVSFCRYVKWNDTSSAGIDHR